MSEKEMNGYRFGKGQEPTDEMLEQIMKEVAQEARESSKKATDVHYIYRPIEILNRDFLANMEKTVYICNRKINQ